MADTIKTPSLGSGIVRVHGTNKALAFTSDVTPRYVAANPYEGGKQAVAEAYRNLISVGALPLAITDNLNFGNPEKPEVMGQLVGAIKGISEAVQELNMPVVSGNVSLYNETDGVAILPTPTIGAVGLITQTEDAITGVPCEGNIALLIGKTSGHLGQSAILAEVFNLQEGSPPFVDLVAEKTNGEFIRQNSSWIEACTDLSDGGIALAAFKMCEAAGIGVSLEIEDTAILFGEDQARYLIACDFDQAEAILAAAGKAAIPAECVGTFGGEHVYFGNSMSELQGLSKIYRNSFEAAIT